MFYKGAWPAAHLGQPANNDFQYEFGGLHAATNKESKQSDRAKRRQKKTMNAKPPSGGFSFL